MTGRTPATNNWNRIQDRPLSPPQPTSRRKIRNLRQPWWPISWICSSSKSRMSQMTRSQFRRMKCSRMIQSWGSNVWLTSRLLRIVRYCKCQVMEHSRICHRLSSMGSLSVIWINLVSMSILAGACIPTVALIFRKTMPWNSINRGFS